VQKLGVEPLSTGLNCSPEFDAHATLVEILDRNRQALRWVLARRGPVNAVFGVSEGGGLAAELAAEFPAIHHLVVIGSGGLTMREDIEILARRQGRLEEIQSEIAAIASDPESPDKRLLGQPYRYWSSMLDIDPLPIYLRVRQPTYVVMGEKDESVPVESAYALRDRLAAARHTNVKVEIIEGASHVLIRDGVDLKPSLMRKIGAWLTSD